MGSGSKRSNPFVVLCLTVAALLFLAGSHLTRAAWAGSDDDNEIMVKNFKHPVVGSWFGKAQQVCPTGADPAINCIGLGPAIPLFTTPTLTDGGIFLGSDSHELGGAPFAPHTAAHGSWRPLGKTGFRADYVFMLPTQAPFPPFPAEPGTITALRFRWDGQVVNAEMATGTVNIYFVSSIPVTWVAPVEGEFPAFPVEANGAVTAPADMIFHPDDCTPLAPCPLIFKFTIKRVGQ